MMSFGAPSFDDVGPAGRWPTLSMLTGLLGCAQGIRRESWGQLTELQQRISYAVRCDRDPGRLIDFQTVQMSTEDMNEVALTPYGWLSYRDPEWTREGKLLNRRREYLTDGNFLVALTLRDANKCPTLEDLKHRLDYPIGSVFIGRACCLPSTKLAVGVVSAKSLLDALSRHPFPEGATSLRAWWPESEGVPGRSLFQVTEDKDWANSIHVGRRRMWEGSLRAAG